MQKDTIGKSNAKVLIGKKEVIKIEATSLTSNNEYEMMRLLKDKINVPKVFSFYFKDGFNHLKMSKIKGKMLCDEELMQTPLNIIHLMVKALKILWSVDISNNNFTIDLDKRIEIIEERIKNNLINIKDCNIYELSDGKLNNLNEVLEWLKNNRPKEEKLVLSHGDLCLPNILVNEGEIYFIDLGLTGVGDIYQDIAICYRSLKDNFFGKYAKEKKDIDINLLFNELGITPDFEKIKYYLILDELF